MKKYDLIYLIEGNRKTVICAIMDDADPEFSEMVGPFEAREAGPKIADALVDAGLFKDRADAQRNYAFTHLANMTRGENSAGQEYPKRMPERANEQRAIALSPAGDGLSDL